MPASLRSVLSACTFVVAAWALAGTAAGQETGSIVAWGDDYYGQCNVPTPNTGFVAVAAGYEHSLGLKADGSILAWGSGPGNPPAPNSGFVAVAAGRHSLALKSNGSIVGWGGNTYGQCNVPAPNSGFVSVAAGYYHSLGLKADGSIVAWGFNADGECNVPMPNSGFVAVSGSRYHSLGLKANGSIVVWGADYYGQHYVPAPNSGFVAIAAGSLHSLGLKGDGSIVAWGYNGYGQCDIPAPNSGFVGVAACGGYSVGLKADGSIVVWGYSNSGQYNVPAPNSGFVALAAGTFHVMALRGCRGGIAPAITQQPTGVVSACSVGSASFTVTAEGTGPLLWQWRKGGTNVADGGNVSGATTATLSIIPVGLSDAAPDYNCVVTNACGSTVSNNATLTVTGALPSIIAQPSNQVACLGGSASFTVVSGDTPPPTYQWRKGIVNLTNGGAISGATTSTLTIWPASNAAPDYNCVLTNDCGSTTSNDASLTISGLTVTIWTQPSDQVACMGGSASFAVVATGSPAPAFQWRKGTANLTNGGNIAGATTATLTINPVYSGDAASNYNCVMTSSCGSRTSRNATLAVSGEVPSITSQPSDQAVCLVGSVSFLVVASDAEAVTYQWRKGTTNLTDGGNISGATTSMLTINPAGPGDAATYRCVVTNICGSTPSNAARLTVDAAPPVFSHQPSNQIACLGGSTSFTVAGLEEPGPGICQWRRGTINLTDGDNIHGATTATLTISPVRGGDAADDYNCVAINTCGSAVSNNAALTVTGAVPSITAQPSNQAACLGGSASFTVVANGAPGLTYQWRRGATNLTNGGRISGATTATLTINPIGSGDAASNYNCVVSNGCGSITSSNATLTNGAGPSITSQPSDQALCSGGSASFTVMASGTPALTYQWRMGTANLADGGNISGTTTATLTINPVQPSDEASSYSCVVTNRCGSATSNYAIMTVGGAVPSISGQPSNQTACLGGSAWFTVVASGGGLTYQWRKGTTNLTNEGNIFGATAATLTINPANTSDTDTNYNCVVTNGCGSVTSGNATLTVGGTGPSITSQPGDQMLCMGGSASFTVVASGSPAPTYQWRRGAASLADGGNISGATTATLTINPVDTGDAATDYNCVVTNTCGSTTSSNATLVAGTPPITGQPSNQAVCLSGAAHFTVTAAGATSYQWRLGTTNLANGGNITGATAATLAIKSVGTGDAATNYNCVVTNACGNTTSDNAALTVNVAPSITDPPSNQAVCWGGSASFTVTTSGTPAATYQWRRGPIDVVDGGNISGATTATLTINPAGLTDARPDYNVIVSNACGAAGSSFVSLAVGTAPVFDVQPVTQRGYVGAVATFSVGVTGIGAVSYGWRRDGDTLADGGNISGATTAMLSINPITKGDAGAYDVVVTDDCGVATSSAARLWLAGDVNCDGVISYADINPFVLALSGPTEYDAAYPDCDWYSADMDGSGQVSFADINLFVALLAGR